MEEGHGGFGALGGEKVLGTADVAELNLPPAQYSPSVQRAAGMGLF